MPSSSHFSLLGLAGSFGGIWYLASLNPAILTLLIPALGALCSGLQLLLPRLGFLLLFVAEGSPKNKWIFAEFSKFDTPGSFDIQCARLYT